MWYTGMMDSEFRHIPDTEKLSAEMRSLFEEWKAEWVDGGKHGPQFFNARIAGMYNKEAIDAVWPEYQALQRTIEYCATALVYAAHVENQGEVIDIIHEQFLLSKTPMHYHATSQSDYSKFLERVLNRTLELSRDMEIVEGNAVETSVQALINTQRAKINRQVHFGLG
jgi:hypothetical protein